MPKSKSRTKRRSRRRAESGRRTEPQPRTPVEPLLRKRIGWPLAIAGLVLFLIGNIGARTGLVFVPFDPHHLWTQWGGAILGIAGVLLATSRR